jgi:hypothetical protein
LLGSLAGLATLVFIVVASVVGIRLLLLSRRTRGLPEFVLGYGLLIIVGVGYPMALYGSTQLHADPHTARWMLALSAIPVGLGWTGVWIFLWRVFRPDSAVARGVTFGALGTMALLCVASIHRTLTTTDPTTLDFGSLVYTGTSLLSMAANVWGTVESLTYHQKMRRRAEVGLGDPVVANRFLLWAVVMSSSLLSTAFPTLGAILGMDATASGPILLGSAVTGLLCSGALWLAFLPPQAYLARLRTA